jgi:hypothetical protein
MRNLAFFGRNGAERRYLLDNALATTVGTGHDTLFEINDVKSLGELLVAILAEKNVLRHGRVLLDHLSAHMITRSVVE